MTPSPALAEEFATEMAEIMAEALADYLIDPDISERYSLSDDWINTLVDRVQAHVQPCLQDTYAAGRPQASA
ncbi:MAG: hypothetical protein IGQ88_03385 [Gloeomargaritaceae cyanobacterium C42_A2020_066]|nr:hypothetical protein [Gloeomargaritaceae cyanobacterium C42_A2020_066]